MRFFRDICVGFVLESSFTPGKLRFLALASCIDCSRRGGALLLWMLVTQEQVPAVVLTKSLLCLEAPYSY